MSKLKVTILFTLLSTLLPGCWNSDYKTPLPGGYALVRTNADTKAIFVANRKHHSSYPNGSIVVQAYVDQMAVEGKWVVGHVRSSPQSELAQWETPGFFILDTETGEAQLRLGKDDWENRLRQSGLDPTTVRLYSP